MRNLTLLLASMLVVLPKAALCDEHDPGGVYRLRASIDVPITVSAVGASVLSTLVFDEIGRDPCPCDPSGINSIDQGTAGRWNPSSAHASDALAGMLLSGAFLVDAIDAHENGRWNGYGADALVMFEAFALDEGIGQLVKGATHRPRPFLYGLAPGDPELDVAENYRSFYSNHTSSVFAVGMAYARTFALRHPRSHYRWAVYTGAALGGAAVGALRVAAGEHFPTDVAVGAVAGSAVGLTVPALHRSGGAQGLSVRPVPGGAELYASFPLH